MFSASKNNNGFTLIELLVTITILSIIFALGMAGYRDFSRRQQLTALARQLQGELRTAQELAFTGAKPTDDTKPGYANCQPTNTLVGYFVSAGAGGFQTSANCSAGVAYYRAPIFLPTGYAISRAIVGGSTSPEAYPMFKVLGSGTNITPASAYAEYTITDPSGATIVVTMTAAGEIK